MTEPQPDRRPPRGALIVVAVGLLACVAAALLTTDSASGEAADLEWVQRATVPDSAPVDVPGGPGQMQLIEGEIKASGTNVSGYSLYIVGSTLRIDAGSPVGRGRILCTVAGKGRSEISRTSGGLRSTFPRSSEAGIYSQDVPDSLLIDFSARGGELVVVEPDLFPAFTTEKGVKVEWPEYEVGTEHIKYFLAGKPKRDLLLPFYTVWKTTSIPAAAISCTLTTSAGKATVQTAGSLRKVSPPIDEEAEELAEEEAEEAEEEKEEKEEKEERKANRPQPAGATSSSGPSAIPFPTLFSAGFAGAPSIRLASSGPSIATASSTESSGLSQAASASGLGRIAGIRLWTGATTLFGEVVMIVQL